MSGPCLRRLNAALLAFLVCQSLATGQLPRPPGLENLHRRVQYELSQLQRELRGFDRDVREAGLEDRWIQSLHQKLRDYRGQISSVQRDLDRLFSAEVLSAERIEAQVDELLERLERIRASKDRLAGLYARRRGEEEGGKQHVTPDETGSIAGRVTDAVAGSGVTGMQVELYDSFGGWIDWEYTDPTGDYIFSGLSDGTYYLRTDNWDEYLDELYDDIPCPSGCDVRTGTPVSVASGAGTTGIDFALDRGGSVLGAVTAADTGAGLSGTRVELFDSSGDYVESDYTDESGDYEIGGLSPGTYFSVVTSTRLYLPQLYQNLSCPGGLCDPTEGTPIPIAENAVESGINFALQRGGLVSGTITDANSGVPLDQVYVTIFDPTGNRTGDGFTNSSGHYSSDSGLETGHYFAVADPPEPHLGELYDDLPCYDNNCAPTTGTAIGVTAGSTTTGIDFGLDQGGNITGSVEDAVSGHLIGDAEVEVYDSRGYWVGRVYTDDLGGYRVVGLSPGGYFAVADPPHPYLGELFDDLPCYDGCDVSGGTPIAASIATTTSGIDFGLDQGGTITGVVRGEATGDPVHNAEVRVYDSTGYMQGWDRTDSQGRYSVNGLIPGNHFAHTVDSPAPYMDELYRNMFCFLGNCDPTTGTVIAASLNTTTSGTDFDLPTGGAVTGRLTNARTGDGISWQYLEVHDFFGFVASYRTDPLGYYTTGGLPIGNYYVRTASYSYHNQRYQGLSCEGTCDMGSAMPVPVTVGGFSTVDFALFPSGEHPDLHISLERFERHQNIETCGSITIGPGVAVTNWAEITWTAGRAVVIDNGFSVSGLASLTVGTDARLAPPCMTSPFTTAIRPAWRAIRDPNTNRLTKR